MGYEQLRQNYLDKLTKTKDVLTEIKETNIDIFKKDEMDKLEKINDINNRFLEKLTKGEIEVAIVGMENSGKSTFANAFIGIKEAFPTGSSRTTFTSTKLRYSDEDKAVVEFFTKEEFNQIVEEMLKKVEYNINFQSFEVIDKEKYEAHFESLKKTNHPVYQTYRSTVHKDIIDILEGKEQIKKYLGEDKKLFNKEQIKNEELKKFITDKYIARTVKNVEIFSSELAETKELVLYDVPGFNSITEKHKKETEEALNRADAIILIKNIVENSEITSEESDILSRYDNEGMPLKEKLFVFGVKADKANTKDDLENNIQRFKEDLQKNLEVKEDRIYIGSPYVYLQKLEGKNDTPEMRKMIEFGLEKEIDSIKKLKEDIKQFYKKEAFENIKRQINKNINSLKEILEQVVYENSSEKLKEIYKQERKEAFKYNRKIKESLNEKLNHKKNELKNKILQNDIFSSQIKEKIETITENVTLDELEKINIEVTDTRNEFATDKVNNEIRKKLFRKFEEEFNKIITSIANDEFNKIFDEIIDTILEILEVEKEHNFYNEIRANLEQFVKNLISDVAYNETSFVYLINRFSKDLIEIVLNSAKASPTRKGKFKEAKNVMLGLAFYYEDISKINTIYDLEFIRKILHLTDTSLEEIVLNKLLERVDLGDYKEILLPIIISIINANISNVELDDILDKIKEVLKTYNKITEANIKTIEKKLKEIKFDDVKNDVDILDILYDNIKPSYTKEELFEEINSDVELIKELLKDTVVKAIGLEEAFNISVVKSIEKIKLADEEFEDFIVNNFEKLKYNDLMEYEEIKNKLEQKQKVISKIQELLKKL